MTNPSVSSQAAFVRRALLLAVVLLAVAAAAALVVGTRKDAISIASGAGIAMASFAILSLVITRSLAGRRGAGWIAALGMVKMGILGALIWWLLSRGIVEPLAFMGGFSTMVIALVIEGIRVK